MLDLWVTSRRQVTYSTSRTPIPQQLPIFEIVPWENRLKRKVEWQDEEMMVGAGQCLTCYGNKNVKLKGPTHENFGSEFLKTFKNYLAGRLTDLKKKIIFVTLYVFYVFM